MAGEGLVAGCEGGGPLDDGELDVVVLAPRGIVGWAFALHRMVTARRGDHRDLRRFACDFVDVAADRPILCELDGDAVGSKRRMLARALPGALMVMVPRVVGR